MIKIHFKPLMKNNKQKKNNFLKKNYKTYFWLLKSPYLSKFSSSKNFNYYSFLYLKKRLDIMIYQIGLTASIKQSRFYVKNLKVFIINSIDKTDSLILKNNSIVSLKNCFFKIFLMSMLFNLKARNLKKKKKNWILKNSFFCKNEFSHLNKLKSFSFSKRLYFKKFDFNKNILLDSKNFNFLFL